MMHRARVTILSLSINNRGMKCIKYAIPLFIIIILCTGCSSGLRTTYDILTLDKVDTINVEWRVSDIYKKEPYKPFEDKLGLDWYQYSYKDYWSNLISMPDRDWGCENCDRYYRGYFYVSSIKTFAKNYLLSINSDDGIWIYINGEYYGHIGGAIHQQGCVNMTWCWENRNIQPFNINKYLIAGKNVIAVHVSESIDNEYFNCLLIKHPK